VEDAGPAVYARARNRSIFDIAVAKSRAGTAAPTREGKLWTGLYRPRSPWPPGDVAGTPSGFTRFPLLVSPNALGSLGRPIAGPVGLSPESDPGAAPVVFGRAASGLAGVGGSLVTGAAPPC
jgi:hypothetical protein